MHRRELLLGAAALGLAPGAALALTGTPYTPGLVERELKAGRTVFVDFYTDWCTTCRSQARTIAELKAGNPAYEAEIAFVAVDWDVHSRSDLARRLKIPRRSTLVVLKGDEELGRIVAGTARAEIRALMNRALAAATS